MKPRFAIACSLAAATAAATAANLPEGVSIEPNAIVHLDAAAFAGESHKEFSDGFSLTEARLGATGVFGSWKVQVLVGFANNKVGLRDVYAQYNFNQHNYIRAGHFVHQFGYQNSTGGYDKPTMIQPVSESIFNVAQRLGVAYVHHDPKFFGSASVFTGGNAINHSLGDTQGAIKGENIGLKCRTAVHPCNNDAAARYFQIGLSAIFETPEYKTVETSGEPTRHRDFSFKAKFPTAVCNIMAIETGMEHARNRWEISPDFLVASGRLALEGQYYFSRMNSLYGDTQNMHGGYLNLRGILKGGNYKFNNAASGLANPNPGTWEGMLTFDVVDFGQYHVVRGVSDSMNPGSCILQASDLFGGRMFNYSALTNFYINKYMVWRLRAGYSYIPETAWGNSKGIFSIQTRLQVVF